MRRALFQADILFVRTKLHGLAFLLCLQFEFERRETIAGDGSGCGFGIAINNALDSGANGLLTGAFPDLQIG
jgi:hypothetical protein